TGTRLSRNLGGGAGVAHVTKAQGQRHPGATEVAMKRIQHPSTLVSLGPTAHVVVVSLAGAIAAGCQDDPSSTRAFAQSNAVSSCGSSPLGCYADSWTRDLPYFAYQNDSNTTDNCISACDSAGYAYAGTQDGTQCWCGNSYGAQGTANNCNLACSGDSSETC